MEEDLDLRISVDAAGAADVNDDSIHAILYSEIWSSGLDEFEGGCGVDGYHSLPLLIRELLLYVSLGHM